MKSGLITGSPSHVSEPLLVAGMASLTCLSGPRTRGCDMSNGCADECGGAEKQGDPSVRPALGTRLHKEERAVENDMEAGTVRTAAVRGEDKG